MTARKRFFRWRAPLIAGLFASSALLASSLAVTPALADPLADKRAEARRLAAEIDSLGQRESQLVEDLASARLAATSLTAKVATATRELAQAEQEASGAKTVLANAALTTYMSSGVELGTVNPTRGASGDPLLRRQYAMTIEGRRVDALDAMRAQLQQLIRKRAALADAQKRAGAAVAAVERSQRAAEEASKRQTDVLAKVKGDLVQLVAEEEQRRAADEAANATRALQRAEAQARQDAARRAAPGPVAPPSRQPQVQTQPQRPSRPATTAPVVDAPAPSAGAQAAIDEAKRQLGKPYRWGGSGPDSFDCSGLTAWAWKAGGRSLPHSSRAQYAALPKVPPSSAQPGDLFFFGNPIHHVGIYVGGGQLIAAPHSGAHVRYGTAYRSDLTGVARP